MEQQPHSEVDVEVAGTPAPIREPDPGCPPMVDPPPGPEPDPEPNPDPDTPDPEPEPEEQGLGTRDQGPEGQRDKGNAETSGGHGTASAPPLVLTSKPVPPEPAKPAAKPKKAEGKKPEEEPFSPFDIMVEKVYDGPLDLLLDLIRKQDIDIYDIPIARITAQFLAYVNQLKASDVDVAGEFIYTASLLIHIDRKSVV